MAGAGALAGAAERVAGRPLGPVADRAVEAEAALPVAPPRLREVRDAGLAARPGLDLRLAAALLLTPAARPVARLDNYVYRCHHYYYSVNISITIIIIIIIMCMTINKVNDIHN